MDYPVCGYMNSLIENTVATYGLVSIAMFLVMFYMLLSDTSLKKLHAILISFFTSVFITWLFFSFAFVMNLTPIEQTQYAEFKYKLVQIKENKSNLTVDQISELKTWAECSISDDELTVGEFDHFINKYDKYSNSNQIKAATKEIQDSIK